VSMSLAISPFSLVTSSIVYPAEWQVSHHDPSSMHFPQQSGRSSMIPQTYSDFSVF
jgi:hypothetical protein